ncbi:multicopper oxidase-domain-containing protein [Lyophyllum atratum]|nr:multicopper oxidase-domain-containing protein [Lyophyllum atratum]
MLSTTIFFLSLLSNVYGGIGPSANLHIVNKNIAPDGFTRSAVLAGSTATNAKFPGPLITGFKGSTFNLNVIDSLTDNSMLKATSIHWHGFFQHESSWADGPVGVTQCPISPGHAFLYKFKVPDQAGTFWYHSHLSTQYCDGLRGAFVVYDLFDPHRLRYDIDDDDTVITLADWYHTPAPSAGLVPTPDATLINGKGRYAGGPTVPLAVIRVIKGLRYRFRLVSTSCDPNYVFSIDGHIMTIIEVDGINVQPLEVDSIRIFAGQRYSFVLKANQPIGNYWVRAKPNIGTTTFDWWRELGYPPPMLETNLHPLTNPAAPGLPIAGGADVAINLAITFDFATLKFAVNGATFIPPTAPVLLQIMSGAQNAQNLLPAGSVYALPPNKVIELTIPGGSIGSPHPFHLHGHAFSVVRSAGSSTYNYANPVQRDVVSAGLAGDNVTIRFKTDNCCHIDWHFEIGLAVVFAEDIPTVGQSNPPTSWDELCPIYDSENPDGAVGSGILTKSVHARRYPTHPTLVFIDMYSLRRLQAMVLGYELDPDTIRSQLEAAAVPVTTADCRSCSDPCELGHESYPDRFDVDRDSQMLGSVKPYRRQVVISTGKSDWDREVTETKGSLAAYLMAAQNHSNLPISEPTPPSTPPPKAVRATPGVFRPQDSTRISILNGSHNTMSDDIDQETVLIFPDYTIVADVPRTREGAQGLWESAVDPNVDRGGAVLEKTPFKTWVLPYSCVILLSFVHSLQENGWAADTHLECHCLMGPPLEDFRGTPEETQQHITKEL